MRIINGKPPNFHRIREAFPLASRPGTIFTYGNTVYVIGQDDISPALKAHEAVHIQQQQAIGRDIWWDRYIADPVFRLAQELPAHRAEYRMIRGMERDRNRASQALHAIAERLAGPLYGGLINKTEARMRIAA